MIATEVIKVNSINKEKVGEVEEILQKLEQTESKLREIAFVIMLATAFLLTIIIGVKLLSVIIVTAEFVVTLLIYISLNHSAIVKIGKIITISN